MLDLRDDEQNVIVTMTAVGRVGDVDDGQRVSH